MTFLSLDSVFYAAIVLLLIALLSAGFVARPGFAVPPLLLDKFGVAAKSTLGVMVGRLHIYPGDNLTATLMLATIMRWLHGRHRPRTPTSLVVLFAIALLGLARGSSAFGIQTAVVSGREI